jgi:hypothetical protein
MATKSLGVLTLDLVAKVGGFVQGMDKAERSSAKWRKQVESDLRTIGSAMAGAAAVAAGAAAIMVKSGIDNAAEVGRLAQLAGETNREFQRQAAGARTVGIENDKLADIFKDVGDKVGDFLQTGAGPLQDFFENIGPKVGITADEFRDLSGSQVLGKYVDALDKAGLSQSEMTFYMEALASDATALLPLLRNDAKEMNALAEQAENLGLVLDDTTIKQAKEFKNNLDVLGGVVSSVGTQIAADLLPDLVQLTEELKDPETVKAAQAMARGITTAFGWIISGAKNTVGFLQWAAESAAAFMNGIAADDVVRLQKEIERLEEMKNSSFLDRTILFGRDGLIEYYDDAELDAELTKLRGALELAMAGTVVQLPKMPELTNTDLGPGPGGGATDAPAGGGGADSGGPALAGISRVIELPKDDLLDYAAIAERVGVVVRASWSDQSQALYEYQQQVETLREGLLAGVLSEDQYNETVAQLEARNELFAEMDAELLDSTGSFWEEYLKAAEEGLTSFDELAASVIENFSGQMGNAFESMVFDAETLEEAFAGIAESMLRSIVNALGQMAAQWLAYQAVQMLVGKTTQASGASAVAANAQAGALLSGINAFASTAAIPIVGPAMAPAAMAAALAVTEPMAAAVATAGLAGMAHDGIDKVPATGTWLLEKGERVTTAETSAKMDRVLEDIRSGQRSSSDSGGLKNLRIENRLDVDGISDALAASGSFERTVVNLISANSSAIRQALND